MFALLGLQVILALACVLGGYAFAGVTGAVSAGLGAIACCVPTAVCVLYLARAAAKPGGASAHHIFVGEAIKIALALSILLVVGAEYRDVSWPALMIGLIVTLQANFFALLVKS